MVYVTKYNGHDLHLVAKIRVPEKKEDTQVMTVVNSDYSKAIEQCRSAISDGDMRRIDPRFVLNVLKDAAIRSSAGTTAATDITAQFTILNAFTGASSAAAIVAAIATANTLLAADAAALPATAVTYVTNTVADGGGAA